VAYALNEMQYQGRADWSQFDIWWLCIKSSSYVGLCAVAKVYLPFLIIIGAALGIAFGVKS
jgi:fatty-acid desaturase